MVTLLRVDAAAACQAFATIGSQRWLGALDWRNVQPESSLGK